MTDKVQPIDLDKPTTAESVEGNVKKTRNKINDLISTIHPLLLFEFWYGIFRFNITEKGLLPASGKLRVICIVLTIIQITLFAYFLKLPSAIRGTSNVVEIMDEVPSIVILFQYVTSSISASFFLSHTNINIFTTVANLDTMLHINSNNDFYKSSRKMTIIFLIFLTIYHILISTCDLATDEEVTLKKLMVLPIYFAENLEILVFCIMIRMLRSRLIVINNYLTNFINDKENSRTTVFVVSKKKVNPEGNFNLIGRMSDKNMKIRDLAAAYDIIGETCYMINQVFNYQIFMTLVSTFTYIVITIWTSLYYYRNDESLSGAMITIILWCFTAILKVGVMSYSCERLLLRRNDTKILVNKVIMDYDLPKPMRVQAKAFMDLIEAWPLRVFIYDMFSVDITLMLKYISVATTYLIVIIQISHFV